jgi:hypothetical protein
MNAFFEALMSQEPSKDLKTVSDLYGWLIGSWEAEVVDYNEDGSKRFSSGEWHFRRVLEGRAVQDVWISPPRSKRSSELPLEGNRYGTTIRYYDSAINSWRIKWINPVRSVFNELIARKEGDIIVQEGFGPDGSRIRWNFSEIKKDSCRWSGEISFDEGKTWKLQAEFFLKRSAS